jgi:hypothetical protein
MKHELHNWGSSIILGIFCSVSFTEIYKQFAHYTVNLLGAAITTAVCTIVAYYINKWLKGK